MKAHFITMVFLALCYIQPNNGSALILWYSIHNTFKSVASRFQTLKVLKYNSIDLTKQFIFASHFNLSPRSISSQPSFYFGMTFTCFAINNRAVKKRVHLAKGSFIYSASNSVTMSAFCFRNQSLFGLSHRTLYLISIDN